MFNKEQLEAINKNEGCYGVLASAGGGKSTLMVERCRRLVHEEKINPKNILITTFTNASAKDLKNKLKNVDCENVDTGTFHSVCQRILTKCGFDAYKQLPEYVYTNEFRKIYGGKVNTRDILGYIDFQKNNGISYNDKFIDKDSDYNEDELREFFKSYENINQQNNILTFTDWLIKATELLKADICGLLDEFRYEYIMVDEHNDSNKIQNELIKLLCPSGNIMCVFDYRQCMYKFRGSDPIYCIYFDKYFENAENLSVSINYRSSKNIIEHSNGFARKYYGNFETYKDAIPNSQENGEIVRFNSIDRNEEAILIVDKIIRLLENGTNPNQIAILYRNNKDIFNIENELKINNIPYVITGNGSNFFDRKEINFILSILRLMLNSNDDDAFESVFESRYDNNLKFLSNDVLRKIEKLSIEKNISLYDASELISFDKQWQRSNIERFKKMINTLNDGDYDLKTIIYKIISLTKIKDNIYEKTTSKEDYEEKMQAIDMLIGFVRNNTIKSFIDFVYNNKAKSKSNKNGIICSTMHGSKGLEWDNVFVIGLDNKFPNEETNDIVTEINCFYVAITRPRKNLYLSEIGYNRFVEEYFEI